MTQIVVDATLHEKLPELAEPVDLIDREGKLLGRYIPDSGADLEAEPTEEELERLARSDQRRYSSAEVFAHLDRLARETRS